MFYYSSSKTWQQMNDYVFVIGLSKTCLLYLFTEREKFPDPSSSEKGIKAPSTEAKGLLHCIEPENNYLKNYAR